MRLRPRWHPEHQHFLQRPHVVGQARGHRWRTRPPHLRRATAVGRLGNPQWLAQARMWQDKVVVGVEQRQLMLQAVLAQFIAATRGRKVDCLARQVTRPVVPSAVSYEDVREGNDPYRALGHGTHSLLTGT